MATHGQLPVYPKRKAGSSSAAARAKRHHREASPPLGQPEEGKAWQRQRWEGRQTPAQQQQAARPPAHGADEALVLMALDIVEVAGGRYFHVWGVTDDGRRMLLRVQDFCPYFYITAPLPWVAGGEDGAELAEGDAPRSRVPTHLDPDRLEQLAALIRHYLPPDTRLHSLSNIRRTPIMFFRPGLPPEGQALLQVRLQPGGNVRRSSAALLKSLASLASRGGFRWGADRSVYEAEVAPLQRFLADTGLAGGAWLMVPRESRPGANDGFVVVPAPRDSRGGGTGTSAGGSSGNGGDGGGGGGGPGGVGGGMERVSACELEAVVPWSCMTALTADATQLADPSWRPEPPPRVAAALAAAAGVGAQQRTPGPPQSARQEGGAGGREGAVAGGEGGMEVGMEDVALAAAWQRGLWAARKGAVPSLRLCTMDVVTCTHDGADRTPVPSARDPVIAICCVSEQLQLTHGAELGVKGRRRQDKINLAAAAGAGAAAGGEGVREEEEEEGEVGAPLVLLDGDEDEDGGGGFGGDNVVTDTEEEGEGRDKGEEEEGAVEGADGQGGAGPGGGGPRRVVFLLTSAKASACRAASVSGPPSLVDRWSRGAELRLFADECELLTAWLGHFRDLDPDCVMLYQARDTLVALAERFAALRIDGGGLQLARLADPAAGGLSVKKVTMYSAAWVRSQSRMASTSNQETWRAEVEGRLVFDVLRQVLTGTNLGTYTLVDCCSTLLGETLEVLPPRALAQLSGLVPGEGGGAPPAHPTSAQPQQQRRVSGGEDSRSRRGKGGGEEAEEQGMQEKLGETEETLLLRPVLRLSAYTARRAGVVRRLVGRLATLPEALEMGRAVGLTIGQVQYNAQMIRTWSLLLRTARRNGYCIGGRNNPEALAMSPYLMHPLENGTVGMYRSPVAVLDFASLYPSLYRAHNLCYTTLVHRDDLASLGPDDFFTTPTGDSFVRPHVRRGVLPSILGALLEARAATRAELKREADPAHRAVLDSRQKALKLTANALYGFTGAGASPLQCVPLADSCLALGAESCKRARELVDGLAAASAASAAASAASAAASSPHLPAAAAAGAASAGSGGGGGDGGGRGKGEAGGSSGAGGSGGSGGGGSSSGGGGGGGGGGAALGPAADGMRVIYAQTDSLFVHMPSATTAQAVELGQRVADLVTRQFPPETSIKFEQVLHPFLLLHVNRYAGRAFEGPPSPAGPKGRGGAGGGKLLVKGLRSMWRQAAPVVRHVLQGSLERLIMQQDTRAAVSFVESFVSRMLSGQLNPWWFIMTGGLWRVTGKQVAAAAAEATEGGGTSHGGGGGGSSAPNGGGGGGGGEAGGEEVRGPHASLAVRLAARDPGRNFVLGERLPYVLTSASKSQDEAAEDPLEAARQAAPLDLQLYWNNKVKRPLSEIFATVLPASQLQSLLGGDHTLSRPRQDLMPKRPEEQHPPSPSSAALGSDGKHAVAASSSKQPNLIMPSPPPPPRQRGGRQAGMTSFFTVTEKCLSCKRAMRGGSAHDRQPALCEDCRALPGRWEALLLDLQAEEGRQQANLCAAHAACRACHSGGQQLGLVLCENGECPVLYSRWDVQGRLRAVNQLQERLDW